MDILGDENKEDKVNAVLPSTQASAGKLNPIHLPVRSIYTRYVIVQQPRCPLDGQQRRMTRGRRGICLTGKYCLLVRHSPGTHQAADSCCRGMYAGNEGLLG